jgi:hypothetical protein
LYEFSTIPRLLVQRGGGYEEGGVPVIGRLHPVLHLGGKKYVAVVSEMAAVPTKVLGSLFTTAEGFRQEVIGAID